MKKRFLVITLVIAIMLSTVPAQAKQAVQTEYSNNKAFNELNTSEKKTYNLIVKECERVTKDKTKVFKARKINYNKYKIGYNRIQKVVSAIELDYPEYYFFNGLNENCNKILLLKNTNKKAFRKELDNKINKKLLKYNNIINRRYESQLQKYIAIANAVSEDIIYSTDLYNTNSHNILGGMVYSRCVCEGYAKIMCMLCNKAKIDCYIIYGELKDNSGHNSDHAWNLVNLDGEWYESDITNYDYNNKYSSLLLFKNSTVNNLVYNSNIRFDNEVSFSAIASKLTKQ